MFPVRLHRFVRPLIFAAAMLFAGAAGATFHLWKIYQLYSNADGSVQYIMFETQVAGQQFVQDHFVVTQQGQTNHEYMFPKDLPGDSLSRNFLIATQGFADLGVLTPDYVVPNGFLFLPDGVVAFLGADALDYADLPTDGVRSLNRAGQINSNNWPTNYAGDSASLTAPVPTKRDPPTATAAVTGPITGRTLSVTMTPPANALNLNGSVFIAAWLPPSLGSGILLMSSSGGWTPFTSCNVAPEAQSGPLRATHQLPVVVAPTDLSALRGTLLFAAYGIGATVAAACTDMVSNLTISLANVLN